MRAAQVHHDAGGVNKSIFGGDMPLPSWLAEAACLVRWHGRLWVDGGWEYIREREAQDEREGRRKRWSERDEDWSLLSKLLLEELVVLSFLLVKSVCDNPTLWNRLLVANLGYWLTGVPIQIVCFTHEMGLSRFPEVYKNLLIFTIRDKFVKSMNSL